jgi:hypothetical protein
MLRLPALALFGCLIAGCATVDYVGESYSPTKHVDVFFAEKDVPRQYRVIGQVLASGDQFVSASALHTKLVARAREKGADGVIVLDVSRKPIVAAEEVTETTKITEHLDGRTIEKTSAASAPADHSEIKALFIRYK